MKNKIRIFQIEREMRELEDLIRRKFARLEGLQKEHDDLLDKLKEENKIVAN